MSLIPASYIEKSWNKALGAAGLPPVPGLQPRPGKFGRIDGIKALQDWTEKHGRPPYSMEWQHAGPDHPTAATMRTHFGPWRNALKEAGLTPTRKPSNRSAHWTDQKILDALRAWTKEHGRAPLGVEWITCPPGHPCYNTVRNHFGTWQKALTAAGLTPRPIRQRLVQRSPRGNLQDRSLPDHLS